MSVAIFGLGRSGLAIATALQQMGKQAVVYDETPRERIAKPELIQEAEAVGAKLVLGEAFPMSLKVEYVVVNPAIDHRHPSLLALSQEGTEIISEIEFAYRISKAPIIAITGTNGKSTTVAMTTMALQAMGFDAVLCGNIFGSGLPEQPLTMAALNSTKDQVLVAEVSSFQLEWVSKFRPKAAAITSLSPDHQDRYNSYDHYVDTKFNIFRGQKGVDLAAVTSKDPIDPKATVKRVLPFGSSYAPAFVDDVKIALEYFSVPRSEFKVLGKHNHMNIAIAMTLASHFVKRDKLPLAIEALKEFKGLSHRMEFVEEKRGIRFINNSMCTNPAAVKASLESIETPIHVLIGGVNKDLSFEGLKDFFANRSGSVQIFGRDAQQINQELGGNYQVWSTMKEAFDAATQVAKEGEIVMLAPGCASMDQFRDFRHRGDVFRTYVTDWTG